jgi:predicted alpha/beta hydrolase
LLFNDDDDDDDDDVLDQHALLDFYCAFSMKQQSMGRYVTPLGHINLISNQPVSLLLLLIAACLAEKQQAHIS